MSLFLLHKMIYFLSLFSNISHAFLDKFKVFQFFFRSIKFFVLFCLKVAEIVFDNFDFYIMNAYGSTHTQFYFLVRLHYRSDFLLFTSIRRKVSFIFQLYVNKCVHQCCHVDSSSFFWWIGWIWMCVNLLLFFGNNRCHHSIIETLTRTHQKLHETKIRFNKSASKQIKNIFVRRDRRSNKISLDSYEHNRMSGVQ